MKNKKIISLIPLSVLLLTSCGSQTYNASDYMLEMNWKSDFKILQLTDIHIAAKDDQQRQFDFMDLTISDANPDLIVITGDLFTFADRTTAKRVFSWLDSHNIPWTCTFGNHDEQCYFPISWMTGYLNKLSNSSESHCIFKDIQNDDIYGNSNFVINLMENNKVHEQVILMDSNRYNFGKYKNNESYIGYDCIHDEQIDWYENIVKTTKENNGGATVNSVAFFHIPLPEFAIAHQLAEEGSSEVEVLISQIGDGEDCCCPDINTGLFDKMLELGSTNGIFVGHDHLNNYAIKYKGITLSYGVTSDDRIYYTEELLGGQTITIHDDGTFDINQILHTYEEVR